MRSITTQEFDDLVSGAAVVGRNHDGVSVWLLGDGRYVKRLRRRRALSSDLVQPYARRFQRAAKVLAERGILTVKVESVARVKGTPTSIVVYRGVEGETLRDLIVKETGADELVAMYAAFLARLHDEGIYFRANHFGNVVLVENDSEKTTLGLIDIGEVRLRSGPLSPSLRARNFKPPLRYEEDRNAIEAFGPTRFIETYLAAAELNDAAKSGFVRALSQQHAMFAAVQS